MTVESFAYSIDNRELYYFSARLRLAVVVAYLRSQQINCLNSIRRSAQFYKDLARVELAPWRKSIGALRPEMKRAVYLRAIELAFELEQSESREGAVEFIRAQSEDAWSPVQSCARYYLTRALEEFFPDRKTMYSLSAEEKHGVYGHAIELAAKDANGCVRRP